MEHSGWLFPSFSPCNNGVTTTKTTKGLTGLCEALQGVMPYADPEKQREAQARSYKNRRERSRKFREAEKKRRRDYNATDAGMESNRACQARWYARHVKGEVIQPTPTPRAPGAAGKGRARQKRQG